MGDLQPGDLVFDERGEPCRVVATHPVRTERPCFKVRFSDGSKLVADEDHLWVTLDRKTRKSLGRRTGRSSRKPQCQPRYAPRVVTTREIAETLVDRGETNHAIPCTGPLQCPAADLPIEPYLLGCWLGDGSSNGAEITTADPEVVEAFEAAGFVLRPYSRKSGQATTYGIVHTEREERRCGTTGQFLPGTSGFRVELSRLGLLGNKHIPPQYLRASAEQRLELLRGLLDTDGHCDPRTGSTEFCSTNQRLAAQVEELALSLGFKAVTYGGRATIDGRDCGPKYRVCFTGHADRPLFRIARKRRAQPRRGPQAARAYRRYIVAVEPVASVPVRCITVDSPSRLYLAGRAMIPTHNTRTGSEWIIEQARSGFPGMRIALVAETAADARDVMVEGDSGILACSPPGFRPKYQPSKRRLIWPNGVQASTFSAEEPDQLRGPQHHKAWCDEAAKWRYPEAFDELLMGLRLGDRPQAVITTTPRPTPLIKSWVKDALGPDPTFALTKGSTYENRANLARKFLDTILKKYEGTRLGRQELEAEILDDAPGALWRRTEIEDLRVTKAPDLVRIAVAIDPSVSSDSANACTGIVAAGLGTDGLAYVLEDASLIQPTPKEWGSGGVTLYHKLEADRIVGEVNNGGDLVEANVRSIDPNVSYKAVRASRGKQKRAEPVASLYEQRRVRHCGTFPLLEDEMCQWEPGVSAWSPNRLDALVWVLTELMLGEHEAALTEPDTTTEALSRWDDFDGEGRGF